MNAMKRAKCILTIVVLMLSAGLTAQVTDTATTFKVSGACEMCKERIEHVLKIRGVKQAVWNIDTKTLQLAYDPTVVALSKIHKLLANAGHDTELERAKDVVYNELPACCHYRELEKSMDEMKLAIEKAGVVSSDEKVMSASGQAYLIKGVVLEEDKKGSFKPLTGASIIWLGTNKGAFTDTSGVFIIQPGENSGRLIISYTGYASDTITITDMKELKIVLASGKQLSEVKVIARQRSTYVSGLSPIRTQVMTEKELFKAACCNLSERFETNPSVDVSFNDAVTGSKQIQLLGLSGNYTQLTVENTPGPRGLATPLGLNTIPGTWVESIQLIKGTGSVINGYESIAGQVNVELKKPQSSEASYANIYTNDFGKTDLNLNLSKKLNQKWSTALLLHGALSN